MTKKMSHNCKNKRQLAYDSDGLCFVELAELAMDHPIYFLVICQLIKYNFPSKLIIKIIDKII